MEEQIDENNESGTLEEIALPLESVVQDTNQRTEVLKTEYHKIHDYMVKMANSMLTITKQMDALGDALGRSRNGADDDRAAITFDTQVEENINDPELLMKTAAETQRENPYDPSKIYETLVDRNPRTKQELCKFFRQHWNPTRATVKILANIF